MKYCRSSRPAGCIKLQSELLEKKAIQQGAITALEKAYRLVPLDMDLDFQAWPINMQKLKTLKSSRLCDSLIQKRFLETSC